MMLFKKKLYAALLKMISVITSVDTAKRFDAKLRYHKELNLKNPVTLSDKVAYIELHLQSPLASMCTDKFAVRECVKQKGLEDILVPLVGGPWERVEDVNFDKLPNAFALKATHGCKMNYFVPDKNKMDAKGCRKEMKRWMKTTYGGYSLEPHYMGIPHRIYAEQYLGEMRGLIDYKIHCIDGEPSFILVMSERKVDGDAPMQVKIDMFDTNWNHIDGLQRSGMEVPGEGKVNKPEKLSEMLDVARKLSEDFKFVRVDLYELHGKIYFGELTFSPAACVLPYLKPETDLEMGKKLKL